MLQQCADIAADESPFQAFYDHAIPREKSPAAALRLLPAASLRGTRTGVCLHAATSRLAYERRCTAAYMAGRGHYRSAIERGMG